MGSVKICEWARFITQLFRWIVPMARAPHTAIQPFKTPFSMNAGGRRTTKIHARSTYSARHQTPFPMLEDDTQREEAPAGAKTPTIRGHNNTKASASLLCHTAKESRCRVEKCQPASQAGRQSLIFQPCTLRGEKDHNSLRNVLFIYLSCDVYLLPCVSERTSAVCAPAHANSPQI
jgi:hypothetical protein